MKKADLDRNEIIDKDEVLKMAIQAGYRHPDAVGQCEDFAYFDIEAFAKLIADVATAKEREACANVCDKASAVSLPAFLAMQIRARGELNRESQSSK